MRCGRRFINSPCSPRKAVHLSRSECKQPYLAGWVPVYMSQDITKVWRLVKPARPAALFRRCVVLVAVVLLLQVVVVYLRYSFPRAPEVTRTSAVTPPLGQGMRTSYRGLNRSHVHVLWKPLRSKVQTIYRYLNLTDEEASQSLPLTLSNNFSMNNPELCGTGHHDDVVDVLFMVHSAPFHYSLRMRLRDTVFREVYFRPLKIRVLFLLGQVDEKQDNLQAALDYEHNLYKDTVQGPFLDTYFNLTHKGVLGFNWISHYCPRARVVFKMDDDVFVDTFQLIHHVLPMLDGKRRTILCSVWFNDTMPIMRNETSPWRVEEKLFCGLKRYPFDYCSGMAVIITGDLIPSLYRAAFFTPFFWIDDLYLFGMLPSVAGDVTLYDVGMGRNMTLNASLALDCKVREGHKCPVLATTASEYPNKFEELWNVTYWLHVNPGWRLPFARVE